MGGFENHDILASWIQAPAAVYHPSSTEITDHGSACWILTGIRTRLRIRTRPHRSLVLPLCRQRRRGRRSSRGHGGVCTDCLFGRQCRLVSLQHQDCKTKRVCIRQMSATFSLLFLVALGVPCNPLLTLVWFTKSGKARPRFRIDVVFDKQCCRVSSGCW